MPSYRSLIGLILLSACQPIPVQGALATLADSVLNRRGRPSCSLLSTHLTPSELSQLGHPPFRACVIKTLDTTVVVTLDSDHVVMNVLRDWVPAPASLDSEFAFQSASLTRRFGQSAACPATTNPWFRHEVHWQQRTYYVRLSDVLGMLSLAYVLGPVKCE